MCSVLFANVQMDLVVVTSMSVNDVQIFMSNNHAYEIAVQINIRTMLSLVSNVITM
jgi:hypothetical protein